MGQTQRISRNNTTIATDGADTVVTLHRTAIVRVGPTEITLDSGGWQTVTTKARMNQVSSEWALGFRVYARRREWFVSFFDETGARTECAFEDGMRIPRHRVIWEARA